MIEVDVVALGRQGDGVAEGPIFVPGALPGERVRGTLDGQVLRDVKIVVPSENRVKPPCRHFKSCGGCTVQHASDALVADWKAEIVRLALADNGLEIQVLPALTSPTQSRRRATFAARRTKKGAMVGFHGRASDTIVDVTDCQLVEPSLKYALPIAVEVVQAGGSRKGVLDVAATTSDAGLDITVSGGKDLDSALRTSLASMAEKAKVARLVWNDELVAQRSPVVQSFQGVAVEPAPGAFLQATTHGERSLQDLVAENVAGAASIVDLFAGCGTFTLHLAKTAQVHAVESEGVAIAALDRAWRNAQGLKQVTHEVRDLFRRPLLPDELNYDVAVIDPPRAGAAAQVAELARSNIPKIVHVSCNPQTFARDAKTLINAGFDLDWVQPVDQFRWSPHVELVGVFHRR